MALRPKPLLLRLTIRAQNFLALIFGLVCWFEVLVLKTYGFL